MMVNTCILKVQQIFQKLIFSQAELSFQMTFYTYTCSPAVQFNDCPTVWPLRSKPQVCVYFVMLWMLHKKCNN